MNITPTTQRFINESGKAELGVGSKVTVNILSSDTGQSYAVRINGNTYQQATLTGDLASLNGTKTFHGEIVSVKPLTINISAAQGGDIKLLSNLGLKAGESFNVAVIGQNGATATISIDGKSAEARLMGAFLGRSLPPSFMAKVLASGALQVLPEPASANTAFQANDIPAAIRSRLMAFVGQELAGLGKLSEAGVAVITAENIRNFVKNSGLFFENKLASGLDVSNDGKYRALTAGNGAQFEAITSYQFVATLLGEFFTLFSDDGELADEGRVRITREDYGIGVHMQMDFTGLGEVIASIVPTESGSYNALIKSDTDISAMLEEIQIEKLHIRWGWLTSGDKAPFDLKRRLMKELSGLDLTV